MCSQSDDPSVHDAASATDEGPRQEDGFSEYRCAACGAVLPVSMTHYDTPTDTYGCIASAYRPARPAAPVALDVVCDDLCSDDIVTRLAAALSGEPTDD